MVEISLSFLLKPLSSKISKLEMDLGTCCSFKKDIKDIIARGNSMTKKILEAWPGV